LRLGTAEESAPAFNGIRMVGIGIATDASESFRANPTGMLTGNL